MSANLQLVQRAYAAALGGSYEDFLALLDDEVTIVLPDSLPHGGTYQGKAGARALRARLLGAWRAFDVVVLEYLSGGDSVVGLIHLKGVLSATGRSVDTRIAEYWRLRAGRVVELSAYYFDTHAVARALHPAAAGP
ncbi:MAG TPA: nuclear transport factor 2 family protein [Steroidobacteraceae bacterium]|nr:nuclear transport factor 2 family protein [Steroidobacteraceae bacterium]